MEPEDRELLSRALDVLEDHRAQAEQGSAVDREEVLAYAAEHGSPERMFEVKVAANRRQART